MGYVTAPVRDEYKMIDTTVTTDKKEYRPRDTVTVTLNAKPRHPVAGKQPPVEIAVVALDEAVLDLLQGGTSKYDPYSGFYKLDPLDVINFSTLTRLIGRQKFEKKGANAGGGGGGGADLATRSLFKFVAYWNPSVPVDAEGNAKVTFKAPDNLTGWRVLAMAVTPEDRMGLGQRSFKVNRPTEARPVMPNQVTEGDTFKAGFNVMNRTGKQRSIQVRITAKGDVKTKFFFGSSSTSTVIDLAPYKRETVWLDVVTKRVEETADKPEGEIVFHVTAGDEMDTDAMIHKTPVKKRRVPLTAANYGSTTEKTITESIKLPEDIHPDWGYVGVVLSPSVIGNVEGAFEYMRFYPYICWEQKLSKGVMASHYNMLKSYLPDSLKWPGSKTLPQATLDMAVHHQAPNGGMTYYVARDMYVSPYLSAYTMLAFNWMRRDGHEVPSAVEEKLAGYLRNLLRRNVYPDWYSNGMASTVRAVALAAMVNRGKAGPAEVRRYAGHVERMSLFGKAHFMMAALKFQETAQLAKSTAETMLGHANQTGGKFILSESYTDGYSRIMESPLRSNCAALSAFSSYAATAEGKTALGDVPFKMVRFITQSRGKRNHFENTQENMFCMNALVEYSRAYESVRPDMKLSASLGYQPLGKTEFTDVRDNSVELSTPMKKSYAGRKLALKVDKAGQGRYYYSARVQYAPRKELAQRQNAGIDIRKEFSIKKDGKWTLLNPEETIHRGDLVRVDIFLSLPAARNFVVVDDPVPGGLEPVNTDLATSSAVDAAEARYQASGGSWYFQFTDWSFYNTSMWSFYHKELRHDSARFYSEYLPPGNYHLSYMAQAIATGRFAAMPPRAEEMYDPDVFGLGLSRELDINE
ncbi:MAG: large extracellular alpha-helical protein, partial [Nitrospinota bacterium]|nr:large extracellular alpha-helical protein [Nitrospinota bacterium]